MTALAWKDAPCATASWPWPRRARSTASSSTSRTSPASWATTRKVPAGQPDRRRAAELQPRRRGQAASTSSASGWSGRIVAFRDPVAGHVAPGTTGDREQVIQTPDGAARTPGYGGFTNFANPVVRKYNIDIAEEAAKRRRRRHPLRLRPPARTAPSTRWSSPACKGGAAGSIVSFLGRRAARASTPRGAFLGASLFGIAAYRPDGGRPGRRRGSPATSTTSRRSSTRPTGGPASSASPTPTASPTRSSRVAEALQAAGRGHAARGWCPGSRTSRSRRHLRPAPGEGPDRRRPRPTGVNEWIMWDPNVTYTPGALTPG